MARNLKALTDFILATNPVPNRGVSVPNEDWRTYQISGPKEYRHGLLASCYINQKSQEMVVAYSIAKQTPLTLVNLERIRAGANEFVALIRQFAKQNNFKLKYTGCQHGAVLAEELANEHGIPAVTFDSKSGVIKDLPSDRQHLLTRYVSDPDISQYGKQGTIILVQSVNDKTLQKRWDDVIARYGNLLPDNIQKQLWLEHFHKGLSAGAIKILVEAPQILKDTKEAATQRSSHYATLFGFAAAEALRSLDTYTGLKKPTPSTEAVTETPKLKVN